MTASNKRAEAILAQARTLRPPREAKAYVRQKLAASVALTAVTAATAATAKASPLIGAKLASAVKAGYAVTPGLTSSVAVSTPLMFFAPITVGLALGLSALTPNSLEHQNVQLTQSQSKVQVAPLPAKVIAPQPLVLATEASKVIVEERPLEAHPTSTSPKPLARQSELLEHARLVLRQGDPTLALRSIETYRKEFPNGAFFVEALTLQASALCKLNRYTEGRNILQRLEASGAPASTLTQTKAQCDVEPSR